MDLLDDHRAALDRLVDILSAHETVYGVAVRVPIAGTTGPAGLAESGGPLRQVQYQAG